MKTKNELIEECRKANPKMIQTVNGVEIELDGEEYEQALADWADMKLTQLQHEADLEIKKQAKLAAETKLQALGLTVEELRALGL